MISPTTHDIINSTKRTAYMHIAMFRQQCILNACIVLVVILSNAIISEVVAGCKGWCARDKRPLSLKCTFQDCGSCAGCPGENDTCIGASATEYRLLWANIHYLISRSFIGVDSEQACGLVYCDPTLGYGRMFACLFFKRCGEICIDLHSTIYRVSDLAADICCCVL